MYVDGYIMLKDGTKLIHNAKRSRPRRQHKTKAASQKARRKSTFIEDYQPSDELNFETSPVCNINENDEILKFMHKNHAFEPKWLRSRRWSVLKQLSELVDKWVQERTHSKFQAYHIAKGFGGFVVPFGSFALGVHNAGSDIDTLIVAPRHVTREDFFTNFIQVLRDHPKVSHIHTIEDAFVPVVKLIYNGIELDLLFARSALPLIPSLFSLEQDWILRNVDIRSVRSMHGIRVTEDLLELVSKKAEFLFLLKTVKFWAKRRGIYGNAYSFPGGVSWAIMVAKICQLCEHKSDAQLQDFFLLFYFWTWPRPVTLRPLYKRHPYLDLPSWNPSIHPKDRNHVMPVITPSYPQINSTFNVSRTTLNIIRYEMLRGLIITQTHDVGSRRVELLCRLPDFYHRYEHYLVLTVKTETSDDLREWIGTISSKLRHLLLSLQDNPNIQMAHVHPNTQGTTSVDKPTVPLHETRPSVPLHETKWIVGLKFVTSAEQASCSLSNDIHNFIFLLGRNASSHIQKSGKQLSFHIVNREMIPSHVSEAEMSKHAGTIHEDEQYIEECFAELHRPDGGAPMRPLTRTASLVLDLKPRFDNFLSALHNPVQVV